MADDPRTFFVDPQEDMSLVWSADWVLGAYEGGGGGGDPENASRLYLLPSGRIVASRNALPTGRLIALRNE